MTRHAPSKCVTLRPDAAGVLVQVAATRKVAPAYAGSYGVWEDQVQAWEIGPCTLAAAVAANVAGSDGYVCRFGGEYFPQPLNRAEQALVKLGTLSQRVQEGR